MRPISTYRLLLKRLSNDWMFLLSIFVGITVASTIVAAAPIYLRALERLALNNEINSLEKPASNLIVIAKDVPLRDDAVRSTDLAVSVAIERNVAEIYKHHERYISLPTYLVDKPTEQSPLSSTKWPSISRVHLRHLSNIEHHLRFLAGNMAKSDVRDGPDGPVIEAIVGAEASRRFKLNVGTILTVSMDLETETRLAVEIAGVAEAIDPSEDFWVPHANIFLDTQLPSSVVNNPSDYDEEAVVDDMPHENPIVPLFITQEALLSAVSAVYPNTLLNSFWFILVDTEKLKYWPAKEALKHLEEFERDVATSISGVDVVTGITDTLLQFEQKRFFAGVPLLSLTAISTATVIFLLSILVFYLVEMREKDATLFKTWGAGTFQLVRLNSLEGLLLISLGMLVAPFLGIVIVSVAGMLPNFNKVTGGSALPIELSPAPFIASAVISLMCLAVYLASSLCRPWPRMLVQKLRYSRPPSMPFFHRHYLDIAVLVIGCLMFWELSQRKYVISGGLFESVEVNEALLVAPVLLLIVVALVFVRLFPLMLLFLSGDSPAFLHLVARISVVTVTAVSMFAGILDKHVFAGLFPAVLAVIVGGLYWWTNHVRMMKLRLTGLGLQAAFVAIFLTIQQFDERKLVLAPIVGLMLLVPGQIIFSLLQAARGVTPVWLSISLWRMARNPLQYTWLIVLLVLTSGLGLVSTTIGTSLEKNQKERINYTIASDVRVSRIPESWIGAAEWLKEQYLGISGVTSVSMALRANVSVGPAAVQLLGLESKEFPYISWYRDDFSNLPLDAMMRTLQSHPQAERIEIPKEADSIGLWVKLEDEFENVSVRVMVEDQTGAMTLVSLGTMNGSDWRAYRGPLPKGERGPMYLVGVHIFEPVLGAVGTPGSLFVDDIHVTVGPDSGEYILEDFEGFINWTPILTAPNSSDRILLTSREMHDGKRSGSFSFGKETVGGVRGFYMSPTAGPMPVLVSANFANEFKTESGDTYIAEIEGRRIPVVVRDTVRYFPTMNPHEQLFVLADLTSLQKNLDILTFSTVVGPRPRLEPNELFISGALEAIGSLGEDVQSLTPSPARVQERATQMEIASRDPLTTMGWDSFEIISLVLAVGAAGLGYTAYLFLFWRRNRTEIGFLQSMGLSHSQLIGILGFEHLTIVGLGLGLGIWAGVQMSSLIVFAVSISDNGDPLVPPLLLTTNWSLLATTYTILIVTFIVSLFFLNLRFRRFDSHSMGRIEAP